MIRATNRLQRLGFIRRIRHGGYYHRNKYEPVWSRFIQVEADWKARRSAPRARSGAAKVSPCKGQSRHVGGDVADPQTCSSNQSKQTYDAALPPPRPDASGSLNEKKGSPKESNPRVNARNQSSRPILRIASSDMAARDAAERRWNKELLDQYRSEHLVYGRIVDAIDVKLSRSTTDAELRQRGSGLNYLINELFARDAAFRETSRGSIRSGSQDLRTNAEATQGGG